MKTMLAATAALSALFAMPALAAPAAPAPAAATTDAGRPAADTALDASRHPAEMLAFSRVKAGDTVIDIWPGAGYWSRLFSAKVGPKGKVIAYVPAEITGFKSNPLALAKAIGTEAGHANVEAFSDPFASAPKPEARGTIDVAWTFENYHDFHDSFMKGADVDAFNRAMFTLLKPGGYYIVVDHAAATGSGLSHTEDLHRIDPATIKAEVEKAGFRFDGESKVLANPADPHTAKIFDPAIRGQTDRVAYRFRKPLH